MKKPQEIKRIGIFPGHSEASKNLAKNLSKCLVRSGFEIVEAEDNPDIIVVSGGDGAMLHAIRVFGESKIPFLGVNAGHVGFLMNSGVDMDSMEKSIERIKQGSFTIVKHSLISCKTDVETIFVFNDLAIISDSAKLARFQVVKLDIEIDGAKLTRYSGDGIIISSAIGSTAYNLSARGPAVHHGVNCLILTPNNPHPSVESRSILFPLVLPAKTRIKISVVDALNKPARLVFDGTDFGPITTAEITTSRRSIELIRFENNYIETLIEKIVGKGVEGEKE